MYLYRKSMKLLVKLSTGLNVTKFVLAVFHFMNFTSDSAQPKRHLRIVITQVPPYNMVKRFPNGSFEANGSAKFSIEWLATRMNFSYDLVTPTQTEVNERGQEAPLFMVSNGQADVCANAFAGSPSRYALTDFTTYPLWEEGYRMIAPRPGEQDRLFAFIDPFDWKVWLLTALSFMVVSFIMSLLTWTSARYARSIEKTYSNGRFADYLGKYFLYNVNVLTNHGDYMSGAKLSFLVFVGLWLLAASILVYGYSSLVVSSITLPKQMPPLNTFEDVLAHPDISLIVRTDTYIGNVINTSTDVPLYNALRKKALNRPESIGSEGVINTTRLLLTGKYAYAFIDTAVRFIVSTQYVREKKCRFKLSSPLSLANGYFYNAVTKGNTGLSRELSIAIMELVETGLVRQYIKSLPWIPKADKCFALDAKKTTKQSSIKLGDLASAFFILGVGGAVSVFVFLAEIAYVYRTRRK